MFNILLLLVFVGGIVIAAVFAGVTFLQGLRSAQEIQVTRQRLIETASRVQSQARYISGYIALPQGASGSAPYDYNQVPTWIDSNARNAAGVPFLYCPYRSASNGGTASTVKMPSGSTYNVNYTSNATTASKPYVTSGDAPDSDTPAGTIGVLIAAAPQSNQPPDCSSISAASDGTPIVTGGIVVPIQDNFLNKMKMATVPTEIKIYIAASATGDGSGRDANNYSTIATAMDMLSYVKPAEATLIFPAGTFAISSSLSWGGRIILEGANVATTTIDVTNQTIDEFSLLTVRKALLRDSGTLTVKGDLHLDTGNLTTTTLLAIMGGSVSSYGNSTITSNVTIDGGGMMGNTVAALMTITSSANRGFKLINGIYSLDNGNTYINNSTANVAAGYIGAGGQMHTNGNVIVNQSAAVSIKGGFVIDPGGRLSVDRSSSNFFVGRVSDYGMYVHGALDLTSSNGLLFQALDAPGVSYGVIMASGGSFMYSQATGTTVIGASSAANRPNVGLYDNGGSHFYMNATTSAAVIQAKTTCWTGRSGTNLFSDPLSGTNNGSANGHLSYTNNSAGMKWLRLYNQSFTSCTL